MFAINHAAAALVLKRRYPTVRMAFILLAVQAVELLWVALNLIGVEITVTDETVRSVQNIHLIHDPGFCRGRLGIDSVFSRKTNNRNRNRTRNSVSPPFGPCNPQS